MILKLFINQCQYPIKEFHENDLYDILKELGQDDWVYFYTIRDEYNKPIMTGRK